MIVADFHGPPMFKLWLCSYAAASSAGVIFRAPAIFTDGEVARSCGFPFVCAQLVVPVSASPFVEVDSVRLFASVCSSEVRLRIRLRAALSGRLSLRVLCFAKCCGCSVLLSASVCWCSASCCCSVMKGTRGHALLRRFLRGILWRHRRHLI
jgi:hypothetical protein